MDQAEETISAARAECIVKENSLATADPPPENVIHQQSKGEPSRTEQSPQVFAQKSKVVGIHSVKQKNTFGRSKLPQRAGVNYTGVEAASAANPK